MRYLGLHQACIRHAQHKNSVRFCALPTAGLKSIALGMTKSKPINASENPQTPATGQVEDGSPKPADGLNAIPRTPPGLHSFFSSKSGHGAVFACLRYPTNRGLGEKFFSSKSGHGARAPRNSDTALGHVRHSPAQGNDLTRVKGIWAPKRLFALTAGAEPCPQFHF